MTFLIKYVNGINNSIILFHLNKLKILIEFNHYSIEHRYLLQ